MKDHDLERKAARRERGYIWMEEKLKWNLVKSTAGIAVFFIVLYGSGLAGSWRDREAVCVLCRDTAAGRSFR